MNVKCFRLEDISAYWVGERLGRPRLVVLLRNGVSVRHEPEGDDAAEAVAAAYDRITLALEQGNAWVQVGTL